MFSLEFGLATRKSSALLEGVLTLKKGKETLNQYRSTSGYPGRQWWGSWELKGGLIPHHKDLRVKTSPLWMPDIKGVEGSFYEISPFEIPTPGAVRGDFGIHFDSSAPGSLGCVVLSTQKGWDAYRRDMEPIAKLVKSIPLIVNYQK